MPDHDMPTPHDLRSFGRRRGRTLSDRQQALVATLLPELGLDLKQPLPADLRGLFSSHVTDVWLEIGFGGAEHLLALAAQHTNIGFIGAEPFLDGVVKALDAVERLSLKNIRLHNDDARALLEALPQASIARAFILFPDPWPKLRQQKRRLVNDRTIALLARALKAGSQLRLATDIESYEAQMLDVLARTDQFKLLEESSVFKGERPADWPATRYEAKARREGRACSYLAFTRL